MPRSLIARLTDALVPTALLACLAGLGLPWLSSALATGRFAAVESAADAYAAGTIGSEATRAPNASPGQSAWWIDLAAHGQLYFAAGWTLLLILWCLRGGRPRLRWVPLLVLAGLPWLSAAPALETARGDPRAMHVLRIAAANVHVSNHDPDPLIAWLRQHPVDVLVVPELSPAYAEALASALPELPHRALHPQAGSAFGMGLYARLPLREVVAAPDADGILALGATLDVGGRPVRVVGVHPMPPVAPRWHAARDRLLHALASGAHPALGPDRGLPRLLAGDLNATPWSSALHLAGAGGLRRATGFRSTWPMQWGGYLGIPIDHVLGSAEWRVMSTRHGPDIGSDHAPIRVELQLAPPPP